MSEAERLRHAAWNAVLALDHAAAISGSENSGHFAAQADALRVALRQQTEEPAQPEPAASVNAGRAVRQMERMISGVGAVEPAAPVEMPVFLKSVRGLIRMAISPECYPVADTKKAAQNVWETTDALEAEWRARAAQPAPVRMTEAPASEPAKVECSNCGGGDEWDHEAGGACVHRMVDHKPAQPRPAAKVNGNTPVGEYDPDMKPADPGAGR